MPFTSSSPRNLSPSNLAPCGSTKLRLAYFSRQGIARIEAPALQGLAILTFQRDPQSALDSRNTVIRKTDDQAKVAALLVAPDEGRPYVVADSAVDAIESLCIGLGSSSPGSCCLNLVEGSKFCSHCQRNTTPQKVSALHRRKRSSPLHLQFSVSQPSNKFRHTSAQFRLPDKKMNVVV